MLVLVCYGAATVESAYGADQQRKSWNLLQPELRQAAWASTMAPLVLRKKQASLVCRSATGCEHPISLQRQADRWQQDADGLFGVAMGPACRVVGGSAPGRKRSWPRPNESLLKFVDSLVLVASVLQIGAGAFQRELGVTAMHARATQY